MDGIEKIKDFAKLLYEKANDIFPDRADKNTYWI
jgi:hypothetical protein